MNVKPIACWTPWIPKANGPQIVTALSNQHIEEFDGAVDSKYDIEDPSDSQDGPSQWEFKRSINRSELRQISLIYDNSATRYPSLAVLKDKIMRNGIFKVSFIPNKTNGEISILFRYFKTFSETGSLIKSEYYRLTFTHSTKDGESQIILSKYYSGINRQLISITKPISELGEFIGYKVDTKHDVIIESIGPKTTVKLTIENKQPVTIITFIDEKPFLEFGKVAVGTYKTSAIFTKINLHPPKLDLSDKERNEIFSKESNDIIFPSDIFSFNDNKANSSKDSFKENVNEIVKETQSLVNNLLLNTKSQKIFIDNTPTDWTVCIKQATDERRSYCEKNHPLEVAKKKCENEFCDICCEDKTSDKHVKYECTKNCHKKSIEESNTNDFNICFSDKRSSIYHYCDNEVHDLVMKTSCQLDMCNLCCDTAEAIKRTHIAFEGVQKCYSRCTKEYNK
jgi:hypothetical protein